MTTICKECKHHIHDTQNEMAPEVWYNHFCGASPLPMALDAVTGKLGYSTGRYVQEHPYKYCRDVNKGNCSLFEPK